MEEFEEDCLVMVLDRVWLAPQPPISRLWLHVSILQQRVSKSLLHGSIDIEGVRGTIYFFPGGSAGPADYDLRSTVLSLE